MQNRYVGDVGDFGKYGLLRQICKSNLALGVNWYLTLNETNNNDGKHTTYLNQNKYYGYDDTVFFYLKSLVEQGNRDVNHIQSSSLLPDNTLFYNEFLDFSKEPNFLVRKSIRLAWHQNALRRLRDCDIVFLDPDNGLQGKSASLTDKKGAKYVALDELKDYYKRGQSVIFYNHRERKQRDEYLDKFRLLKKEPELSNAVWLGLQYNKGTIRDYIFVLQPHHYVPVKTQYDRLLATKWSSFFCGLAVNEK